MPLKEALRTFERAYLIRLLEFTAGNMAHAAKLAHRNRTQLYRLVDRHGLAPANFRTPLMG